MLLLLLSLVTQDTLPQKGLIAGVVTDQSNHPVHYAVVQILPGGLEYQTGREGQFSFPGLKPGSYRLIVSALGFRREIVQVMLSPESGWRGRVGLAPMVHQMPELRSTRPPAT